MALQTTLSVTGAASTALTGRPDCVSWNLQVQQGESGTIYFTTDGSTPSASNGNTLTAGQSADSKDFPHVECKATIKVFASAGTIKLNVRASYTMD